LTVRSRGAAWVVDGLLALALAVIAITLERQTQGRIASQTVALWVGGGSFVLLRVGAALARAGRTLGCLFVFTITWLLPCAVLLYIASSTPLKAMVRDSLPLFVLLGFILIFIMVVTFERIRVADVARYNSSSSKGEH
jgi:hypothetical protein